MFGNITLAIAGGLATLIEVLLAVLLTDSFFRPRFQKKAIKYILVGGIAAILFGINWLNTGYLVKTIIEIFLILLFIAFFYTGKLKKKIICCIFWTVALAFSSILSSLIISILPIESFHFINQENFIASLHFLLPRACLMAIIFLSSTFTKIQIEAISLRYWLMLLTVPFVTIFVLTVFQYHISTLPDDPFHHNVEITVNDMQLSISGAAFYSYMLIALIGLLMINIIVFVLFFRLQKNLDMQNKYDLLCKQLSLQEESIEKLETSYTQMRELRHDMQNQLLVIRSLLDQQKYEDLKDYLKTMTNRVDEATFMTISGKSAVDAVLNEKLWTAHKNQITTSFDIAKLDSLFVEQMDLCIILANILDNAVEACQALHANKERYIRLKLSVNEEYLLISCENPVEGEPIRQGDFYLSSKKEKQNHGLGLKSIQTTADKYHGEYMTRVADGKFHIIVKLNRKA